jgi:hypothetical protein
MDGLAVYRQSVSELQGTIYFLARSEDGKRLGIIGNAAGFAGERGGGSADAPLLCRLTADNAAALRQRLPWLNPRLLGLQKSVGCGDRLGMATPGHLRAVRDAGGFAIIPAQQSMRENARTGRSPRQVLDDAMWGLLQEGWQQPWGADADHLKSIEHIEVCVAAGYTFFTIDPGSHVDNEAHTAPASVLRSKLEVLPWDMLEDSAEDLRRRYLGRRFDVESFALTLDEVSLARAAAKYGRAIAHTVRLYRHLRVQTESFELEVSVDETETPTSLEEHYFVASELKRMGVHWVSLAPRYVGRFEKGVDYLGNLTQFERQFARHAAIARALGPYKLSLHSGSDKFSIYPVIARHAGDLAHVKTAGTSYLEALRAIARVDAALFRDILAYACERYDEDKATYHVSANLAQVPAPSELADHELAQVLDQFDGRQVLHVTFGSVLDHYGSRLMATLKQHEETYYAGLQRHFERHLSPFTSQQPPP